MNTRTHFHPALILAAFLAVTVLFTSACSIFTPRLGQISQVVEVSLDEQLFRESQPRFKVQNHDFWQDLDVDVTRMELHDGFIRFLGTQRQADGTRQACTIDVQMGAEDGMLTARIIALDVPGLKLSDPVVVTINRDMQAMLSLETYDSHAEVLFQEVEVTEDALRLMILVNVRF